MFYERWYKVKQLKNYLRIVVRAVLWVERRCIEDLTVIRMGPIEAHNFGVELVDLLMGTDTESQVVQTRVALVMRVPVARRDKNNYWTTQKSNVRDEKKAWERLWRFFFKKKVRTLACCPGVHDTVRLLRNFIVAHEVDQQDLVE